MRENKLCEKCVGIPCMHGNLNWYRHQHFGFKIRIFGSERHVIKLKN